MKKKRILVFLLIFFVSVILVLYFSRIYSFLAYYNPVQPDVLIVEGWLSEEILDKAVSEFQAAPYRYLITTGFPYNKGFLMGSAGNMVFTIGIPDTILAITVTARGTKAYHEYPHFRVYADTVLMGETLANSKTHDYTFTKKLNFRPGLVIINYDNDTYAAFRDRNLIVHSISVNDKKYDVNAGNVAYYERSSGMNVLSTVLDISTAHEKAAVLFNKGIPDSLIIPIGSFQRKKSKTYTCGLDVNAWLMQNPEYQVKSINILTSGSHARRSYLSYRKAIQDTSVAVGVISCHDPAISETNWWRTRKGIKAIVHETLGYLYVKFFIHTCHIKTENR